VSSLLPPHRRNHPTIPTHRAQATASLPRPAQARTLFPFRLRAAMSEWRRITSNASVLRLIEHGLEIEFHDSGPLRRRSPEFHGSPEQQHHLARQLEQWLADCVIDLASGDEHLTSLLFPVDKPGPKRWRWVLDCKHLNQSLRFDRFKMASMSTVRSMLRHADWLTSIDLQDAYLHVPLTRRSARYLAFRALGRTYRFRAMLFGLASAPGVFTMLMKSVVRHLHLQGVRALAYLDDVLIAARSREESLRHTRLAQQTLERLGFALNYDKSELEPTQQLTYLGLVWDTARWTVQPPRAKLLQIGQDARRALKEAAAGTLTARRLAGLAGKLVWAANGFAALHFRRRSLHRAVKLRAAVGLGAGRLVGAGVAVTHVSPRLGLARLAGAAALPAVADSLRAPRLGTDVTHRRLADGLGRGALPAAAGAARAAPSDGLGLLVAGRAGGATLDQHARGPSGGETPSPLFNWRFAACLISTSSPTTRRWCRTCCAGAAASATWRRSWSARSARCCVGGCISRCATGPAC
jgi:hypothetical protein